jgi:hypothetical protein
MWETIALELLKDNVLKAYVDRLIGGSGMTDRILTELCVAVERGDISPDAVDRVGYTGPSFDISIRRCTDLIEWCVKQGTPRLVQIGLKTAHVLFCHGKDVPPIPAQPLLDLLTAPKALDPGKRGHFHYEWAEIVKRYVAIYPQHAMCLLESTLHCFSDFDFVLDMMHSAANDAIRVLISRDPKSAWTMIASRLVPLDGLFARNLREWLGPRETIGEKTIQCMLSNFDPRDILAWIDIAQQERAPFIARKSPKTFGNCLAG